MPPLTFDYVILAAQGLRHVGIEKCDKTEGSEGAGYKHVRNLAELGEILPQVIRIDVLCAAANEHFARHLVTHSLQHQMVNFRNEQAKLLFVLPWSWAP